MSKSFLDDFIATKQPKVSKEILGTRIFYENMLSDKEININIGGGGSSKSHSIIQLLLYKFLTEKNKKMLVIRKTLPSIRNTVIIPFYEIMSAFGVRERIKVDKVGMNLFYGSNMIHFNGLDDPEKVKCGIEGTEVLTENGFKKMQDVKVGELVASMNPETREVHYTPVTQTFVYDYNGDIFVPARTEKRGAHLDFGFTPEHKFIGKERTHTGPKKKPFYKFSDMKFIEAKDLPGRFYIPRSGTWDGKIVSEFTIPNTSESPRFNKTTTFPIVPWLKFLGWFISEGCLRGTSIGISQTKPEGIEKIKEDLKDFPSDYNISYRGKSFWLNGRSLSDYLYSLGKYCHEKRIPREILNLHPSLLQHLFDSLMAGDGTKLKSGRFEYSTTSVGLKDDVCELALRLGFTINVNEPRSDYSSNYKNGRKYWKISIYKQDFIVMGKPTTKKYEGKVYCLETKPYHTILTRYNGKVIWTGQSSNWNYMWFEEATEIELSDFNTVRLYLRAPSADNKPNQIFISFNPIDEFHWIKNRLIDDESFAKDVKVIHSTYKDNPFLPEKAKQRYEELINQDVNFYRIYALGEWGKLENLIYRNWEVVDSIPAQVAGGRVLYGLDFGWNDPTVITRSIVKDTEVWHEELLYQPSMTNKDLITFMKTNIPKSDWSKPIYADAQYPDKIREIRLEGFNIKAAQKNVGDGIDMLKRFRQFVLKSSSNLIKEFRAYSWRTDKHGNILDEPVDFLNHGMDSMRYALYSQLRGEGIYKVRWV
jgi:PBSX family phage terminase large subunit